MASFSVGRAWLVTVKHSKRPVILTNDRIEEVNVACEGEPAQMTKFVRIAKGDVLTMRLILGHVPKAGEGTLAHTNIIETLCSLRDAERERLINEFNEREQATIDDNRAAKMEGKIDVSFDGGGLQTARSTQTKKRCVKSLAHRFVTITAPAFLPEIASVNMMVLIEPDINKMNNKVLFVHLSELTLGYLHAAAMAQIESKSIHNAHPSVAHGSSLEPVAGVVGLSRFYSGRYAGQYRFVRRGKRQLIFRASNEESAKKRALEAQSQDEAVDAGNSQDNGENDAADDDEEEVEDTDA